MKVSSFNFGYIGIIALLCCTYLTNEVVAHGFVNSTVVPAFGDQNAEDKQVYYNRSRNKVIVTITSDIKEDASIIEHAPKAKDATSGINKIVANLFDKPKKNAVSAIHDVTFSPNFEEGYFYLSFISEEEDDTQVLILDVAGRELHSETIETFAGIYESRVNIPAEMKGTFFLKVKQGLNLVNKKIEVEQKGRQ